MEKNMIRIIDGYIIKKKLFYFIRFNFYTLRFLDYFIYNTNHVLYSNLMPESKNLLFLAQDVLFINQIFFQIVAAILSIFYNFTKEN